MAQVRKRPVMEEATRGKKDNNYNLPLESDEDAKKTRPRRTGRVCICLSLCALVAIAVIVYIGSVTDDMTLGYFGDNTKDVYNRKVAEEIKNTVGPDGKRPDFFKREDVHVEEANLNDEAEVDMGDAKQRSSDILDVGVGDDGIQVVEMQQHGEEKEQVPEIKESEHLQRESVQAGHTEEEKVTFEHVAIEAQGPVPSVAGKDAPRGPERSRDLVPSSESLADTQYPQPPAVDHVDVAPPQTEPQMPAPLTKSEDEAVPLDEAVPQDGAVPQADVQGPAVAPPQADAQQNLPAEDAQVPMDNLPRDNAQVHVENLSTDNVQDPVQVPAAERIPVEPAHVPGEM